MQIPWFHPETGEREKQLVLETLNSNYLNDGEVTRSFEKKMAAWLDVKHCVAVTNGTAAMALALMGLGIGPGDEVIVPDLTFIATANAVRLAGAQVKLVDIESNRFTLDPEKVSTAVGPRTRALIPVDVNGRGADYDALLDITREKGLFLISDSCEALGSQWKGKNLGTFGDAGCFSFSPNKRITTGQGGMVVTNNSELYYRLLELKDQGRREQGTGGDDLHPVLGFNFKLTNLQAAVGLAQFEKLPQRLRKAKQRDGWYRELLHDVPGLQLPLKQDEEEILEWTDVLVEKRDRAAAGLKEASIGFRPFWLPLHRQKPYQLPDDNFENAIFASRRGLWLPSSFDLTREDVQKVATVIHQTLGR